MVSRRDLLQLIAVSGFSGITGCNTFIDGGSGQASPQGRTTPTETTPPPTKKSAPATTAKITLTPTTRPPSIPVKVGTPVYRPSGTVDEFGHAVALSTTTAIVVAEEHGAYVFDDRSGWTNTTVLRPNDRPDFGGQDPSAAMVSDRVVVGGPEAGAAYLFERTKDGWNQHRKFNPDSTIAGNFGRSVAFDGDRVVVGDANEPTTMVSYIGGAYVFANDGGDWTLETSVTTDAQNLFGTAVAIDGQTLLVGAPFADPTENQTGAVYVYERVSDGWKRQRVLAPAEPSEVAYQARFGQAVALEGDTAVVGAPEIHRGTGRAFVFERTDTGWTEKAILTAKDVSEGAEFGRSVALMGDAVVIGAPQAQGTGRAYVFRSSGGWENPLRLAPSNPHEDVEFGADVTISDTTALVGSPVYDATSGAYLFEL